MSEDRSFPGLMDGLRAGSPEAASQVFLRFSHRLVALAFRQFSGWGGAKVDPEGVVQSVFRSFFARCERGCFELDDWDQLWGLLAVITVRKCNRQRKYLGAKRRCAEREAASRMDDLILQPEAIDREPTPLEAVTLADLVQQLLAGFKPTQRHIVEMSLGGYSVPEVALEVKRSERTVWRVRERLKERLLQLIHEDGATGSDAAQPASAP